MNTDKRPLNVLFIASGFPPMKENVTRTTKFVKYLDRNRFKPHILTINIKSMEGIDHTYDKEIPKDLKIHRAYFPNLFANAHTRQRSYIQDQDQYRHAESKVKKSLLWLKLLLRRRIPGVIRNFIAESLLIPDSRMPWIPFAVLKGIRVCRKENIDIVYSSSPWYSNNIVAWIIKRISRKKWVADYRDLWTGHLARNYGSRWRKKLERRFEKWCLNNTDTILVTTHVQRSSILEQFPGIDENKIKVITNGYDLDDFKDVAANSSRDNFIISYTGVIYPSYRLDYFLNGLGDLIKEHPSLRNEITVLIVGSIDNQERSKMLNIMKLKGLEEMVKLEPPITRAQAIELQKYSSLLLLHLSLEMVNSGSVASKLFDYWVAEKPVLALVPPNSLTAEYVIESNCGSLLDPSDTEGIKKAIWTYYQEFKAGSNTYHPNQEFISRFDRRQLTKQLDDIFDSISKRP